MKLELETGPTVKDPDAAAISKSLACVQGFAILSKDKLTYIQASGSAKDGFLLEYQAGGTDQHYQCPHRLSLEQATRAFVSYAEANNDWKTSVTWQGEVGDVPSTARSIRRHISLTTLSEFGGGFGAAGAYMFYKFHLGFFPPRALEAILFLGLTILGIVVPYTIFKYLIGAKCPAPGCHGKAFREGSNPITYVCRSCKRSYDTGMSEGSDI